MKHFTLAFILIALFLQANKVVAQCLPPENPFAFVNINENIGSIMWDEPTHPCIDLETVYYEMEVGYFPFTPGLGQGLLVTPLYGTFHSLPFLDFGLQIWVRTVCTCASLGDCCTEGVIGGEWVMATVFESSTSCFQPDNFYCNSAQTMSVNGIENCSLSYVSPTYCIASFFGQSAPLMPCSSSSNEGLFTWFKFNAPASGSVSVSVSGAWQWNDFGFRLLEGNCNGQVVHCEPVITNEDTTNINDLIPGALYYIGVWNNNFYFENDDFIVLEMYICEAPPLCIPPSDLSTSDATDVSVLVQWNANGSELWDLEYGYEGFTPSTGNLVEDIDASPYMISGLEPLTTYDVYLKSICEPSAESEQIGPVTFETGIPTYLIDNSSIIHSIFPNPTTGQLNILLNENGPVLVELFRMDAQRVLMQNQTTSGFSIDLAHLAKGMYSIRLTTNQQTVTEKVILK